MTDTDQRGYLLEFNDVENLLRVARKVTPMGYEVVDAFTPFPISGLETILPRSPNPIALLIFLGGLIGGVIGYGMQYYSAVVDYPILSGGKPMHSWPAFLPVTFEMVVLFAAITGFMATLCVNRLPQLHHPIFEVKDFNLASLDRFFLLIKTESATDPQQTREDMEQLSVPTYYPVNPYWL